MTKRTKFLAFRTVERYRAVQNPPKSQKPDGYDETKTF